MVLFRPKKEKEGKLQEKTREAVLCAPLFGAKFTEINGMTSPITSRFEHDRATLSFPQATLVLRVKSFSGVPVLCLEQGILSIGDEHYMLRQLPSAVIDELPEPLAQFLADQYSAAVGQNVKAA